PESAGRFWMCCGRQLESLRPPCDEIGLRIFRLHRGAAARLLLTVANHTEHAPCPESQSRTRRNTKPSSAKGCPRPAPPRSPTPASPPAAKADASPNRERCVPVSDRLPFVVESRRSLPAG